MPTYTFQEEITEVLAQDPVALLDDPRDSKEIIQRGDRYFLQWTEVCSISEMEVIEARGAEVMPASPFIGDAIRQGTKKPSDGFRDILRSIKKKHKGGKRNDATKGINTF